MNSPFEFYADFSSPYADVAYESIDALAARHGRTVRRHAILLGATFTAESGLEPQVAEAAWSDPEGKDRLRQAHEQANQLGVLGAPFFIVDGEPFWGNDRKSPIERCLAEGSF